VVIEFMSDSRIINSSISSNWAALDGGGIHATSAELEITNNLISGNASSDDGGGVYLLCCEFAVANNQILTNIAIDFGGGLAIDEQTAIVLENNQIIGNYALKGGGAAFGDVDDAVVVNNIISNNESSKGGGLHLLAHESRNMVFINNAVIDNEGGKGSGIYAEGLSADFLHNTIARNWADDGDSEGVYITTSFAEELNSHVYFTNTIIFSHTVGVLAELDNTVDLNGVLWSANGSDTSGDGHFTVANALTGSPDFSVDGYHLEGTSAGIDNGVSTVVNFDIDGQVRPIGPWPDLGVDEYMLLDFYSFLPIIIKD
jgi:hypothetical protein